VLADLRQAGAATLAALADGLNERGIPAARGGRWRPVQVLRLLARCDPDAMRGGNPGLTNAKCDLK
jgi:hypothetical protein